jgi:anti-sigma B factor antagonist
VTSMDIQYSELNHNIRLIKLAGALDIAGTEQIETRFVDYCGGENARVIVDLSQVDFLASIGIRLLTLTAKSLMSRGGKMVLLNPTPDVQSVLEITGIPAIIPIYSQLESAEAILLAS